MVSHDFRPAVTLRSFGAGPDCYHCSSADCVDSAPLLNVNWHVPDVFSAITAGDVISQRVTLQDPICHPAYPHRCQFYRYAPSRDGLFEVAMAWKSLQDSPLDIDVTDPDARTWDVTFIGRNERRVQLRVKEGSVYWVSIWSADAPGEPFVLTASLQAD